MLAASDRAYHTLKIGHRNTVDLAQHCRGFAECCRIASMSASDCLSNFAYFFDAIDGDIARGQSLEVSDFRISTLNQCDGPLLQRRLVVRTF